MVIFSGLFTGFGRLIGAVATTTIAWATILLFGRIPRSKAILLSIITMGSLIWLLAVVSLVIPTVAALIVAAVPRTPFIQIGLIHWILFALAVFLPLAIGFVTIGLTEAGSRTADSPFVVRLVRGYLYTVVYAVTIVLLAAWGLVRKVRGMQHDWTSEHVPMIVKPGRYEAVVADLESALREAGLEVVRTPASRWLGIPLRLLGMVGGSAVKDLIPGKLIELTTRELGVVIYPSDVALLGQTDLVARGRAAVAKRLTYADAYLTTVKELQQIEDRLAAISLQPTVAAADFAAVDTLLDDLDAPYDQWQTLYRLRLQVEREWQDSSMALHVAVL